MKLRAGYGYWAIDYYPIGGDFRRAPKDQDCEVADIEPLERPYKGATHKGWITLPGVKHRVGAAFNLEHCTP